MIKQRLLLSLIMAVAAVATMTSTQANAGSCDWHAWKRAQCLPWHNAYYDPAWGQPIALVVPPTAELQSNYGWGVGGTRVSPIYHQFRRPYPGYGAATGGAGFMPTPAWPSDTTQFGVYYIRGPW